MGDHPGSSLRDAGDFGVHKGWLTLIMDQKKNDIRPPLVGQASTSSNESSLDLHENDSSGDNVHEPRPRYEGAPASSESSDKNSNDEIQIITQIARVGVDRNYPVGCSTVTSADTSLELPDGRIPTPSSVSSLNSKRGLEWDNLGDVGYSNVMHTTNSLSLSDTLGEGDGERDGYTIGHNTLERIVSMETERRFDPEGTTESSVQNLLPAGALPVTPLPPALGANSPSLSLLNGSKPLQFQLGKPVAESTPNSNNQSAVTRDPSGPNREFNASAKEHGPSSKDSGAFKRDYGASKKDYGGSIKEYHSSKDYSVVKKDYSGSNNEVASCNDKSGSSKEYNASSKEYNASNKNYGASNKDYITSTNDYSGSKKEQSLSIKEHSSSTQGVLSDVFVSKMDRSTVKGSSSDNDPITEYEIRHKRQKSDGGDGPCDRSPKGDTGNGRTHHTEKRGEPIVEIYVKGDDRKDVKDEMERKRNHGDSGQKRDRELSGRDAKRHNRRGEKEDGDYEEVLAKYGRGRARRDDIGGSQKSGQTGQVVKHHPTSHANRSAQMSNSVGLSGQWPASSKNNARKVCESNSQSSSSKNSPNRCHQGSDELEIEQKLGHNSEPCAAPDKISPTSQRSATYRIADKPTSDGHRRVNKSGDVPPDSTRGQKCSGSGREGSVADERAVDQCRKNNEHIKEIVEKYNKSLKAHRQQMRQADQTEQNQQRSQEHDGRTAAKSEQQLDQTDRPIHEHYQQEHHQHSRRKGTDASQASQKDTRTFASSNQKGVPHVLGKSHQGHPSRKSTACETKISVADSSENVSFELSLTYEELAANEFRPLTGNDLPGDGNSDMPKPGMNSSLDKGRLDGRELRNREKDMRNHLQRVESKSKHRRKYYRLFPHFTEDGCGVRRTNSMEDMLCDEGLKSSTLPRYHSVASLTLDDTEDAGCYSREFVEAGSQDVTYSPHLPPPYSASSSSLSTIITKRATEEASPHRLSKLIQTSGAVQNSVTTQTVACTEDGAVCTGAHPRRTSQPIAHSRSHNTSDVEDSLLLIRESNPGDCKTNCNTLDSIGSEETVGSWVGKTYYNNRKPDGESLEDDPSRKLKPQLAQDDVNGAYEGGLFTGGVLGSRGGAYTGDLYGRDIEGAGDIDNEPDNEGVGGVEVQDGRERSDQIDRVNSFEYLPGPVYEQNQATQDSSSDDLEEEEEDKDDLDREDAGVNDLSHSGSSSSLSSTLQCDVITGVNFIQDLLVHSRNSKKFIKHFVHTLIQNSSSDALQSRTLLDEAYRVRKSAAHRGNGAPSGQTVPPQVKTANSGQCASNFVGTRNGDSGRDVGLPKLDGGLSKSEESLRKRREDSESYKRGDVIVVNGNCKDDKDPNTFTKKNNYNNIKRNIEKNSGDCNEKYNHNRHFNSKTDGTDCPIRTREDIRFETRERDQYNENSGQRKNRNRVVDLKDRFADEYSSRNIAESRRYAKEIDGRFKIDPNGRYSKDIDGHNRDGQDVDKNRFRSEMLHQNVPFTPVSSEVVVAGNDSREENISGESATKSSMGLSDVTPERDRREEDHSTSSEFFKPSPNVFNLQPSILYARPNSTTLTSEDDSRVQRLPHSLKTKPRPLSPPTQLRPQNQPDGQASHPISQPLGSRSEEEVVTRQEIALRLLYEKQRQVHRNKANQTCSSSSANSNRAVNADVPVKSILTNRKREPGTSPTLSSSPGKEVGADNWRSPVTESEKLYAMRKRAGVQPGKSSGVDANETLVGYLQLERQNQLDWIKAEIDHLNNLKNLLEKQETLKRSLSAYKQTRRIRSTLSRPSASTQPPQHHAAASLSSSGSNPHPPAQDSVTQLPPREAVRSAGLVQTVEGNANPAEKDRASIYAHKMNGNHKLDGKEERSRLLLPCEYRRRRATAVPTSLKLKHNINEMMTRSVKTMLLDQQAKSACSRVADTSSVAARPSSNVKTVESTAIQTSDSILNLPHWLQQPERVQPSAAQDKSSHSKGQPGVESDRESTPCPCLAALYHRLEAGETECGRGRVCKCFADERRERRLWEGSARPAMPSSVGYVITFEPLAKKSKKLRAKPVAKSSSNGCMSSDTDVTAKPVARIKTLQEYLEENRPDYVSKAEQRRQCLSEKSYLREQRDSTQHKQRILLSNLKLGDSETEDRAKRKGADTGVRKIFTTRELRSRTRRKYQSLPEVQLKKMDAKRKEDYRTNKLMAEVFTKKLQRKALKGVVDLSNSDQVLGQVS